MKYITQNYDWGKDMEQKEWHETKLHGKISFPYVIYRGNIPEYIHSYPMHWHQEMEFIVNISGHGYVTVQSVRYELQPGDIMIILPYELHAIEQYKKESMEYFNVLFQYSLLCDGEKDLCYENYLVPFLEHTRIVPSYIHDGDIGYQEIHPILQELFYRRKECVPGYELVIKARLFQLIYEVYGISREADSSSMEMQQTYEKIKNVLHYVHNSYGEEISVKEAACLSGFSESHFMYIFKKVTGQSFIQYVKKYRLEAAARQLLKQNKKTIEIAEDAGFSNYSYFIRSFEKEYGMTPFEYKTKEIMNGRTD